MRGSPSHCSNRLSNISCSRSNRVVKKTLHAQHWTDHLASKTHAHRFYSDNTYIIQSNEMIAFASPVVLLFSGLPFTHMWFHMTYTCMYIVYFIIFIPSKFVERMSERCSRSVVGEAMINNYNAIWLNHAELQ